MLKLIPYTERETEIYKDGYTKGGSDMEKAKQIIIDNLLKQIENARADAVDECADKFAEILSDIPNLCAVCPIRCSWQTEGSCKEMYKKWLLEQLKENKNEQR